MPQREWAEYLSEVAAHLSASRAAIEMGSIVPPSPEAPSEPMGEEFQSQAQLLAAGYDQLALEVSTRMSDIQRHRRATQLSVRPNAQFFDQLV
jgi:hypothetical protein